MRCAECAIDPLPPAQYCECCGRKHAAAASAAPEPTAPEERVAYAAPCESCGGPSDNETSLCTSCRRVFQDFLDPDPMTPASDRPATAAEPTLIVEASPVTGLAQSGRVTDAPHWFDVALAALPPSAFADAAPMSPRDLLAAEAEATKAEVAREEAARVEAAEAEGAQLKAARAEAERIEAARVEAAKMKAVREEAVKEVAARALAAKDKTAQSERRRPTPTVATPPTASTRYGASIRSRRQTGSMMRVAVVVLVTASGLGLGGYWFKIQGLSLPGQAQRTPVAPTAIVAEPVSTSPPPAVVRKTAKAREVTAAAEQSRVVPSRVPPAVATTRPVASVPVKVDVPVYEATTSRPAAVVPSLPASSAAPLPPFFETRDVNVAPQVAGRVALQLPDGLRAHELNDIVVVHVLVSQSGQPSNLSLLRRSKAGRSVDDAVVTAVKQWTFSPARKKGEVVSCWLNVGVPVGRTN